MSTTLAGREFNYIICPYLDRPICRGDQKRVYGIARNEAGRVLCEVESYPPPTSFKWSFNNTAETVDMPQSGFEEYNKSSSILTYTPMKVCLCIQRNFSPNNWI